MGTQQYKPCHENDVWTELTSEEIQAAEDVGREMYRVSQERGDRDFRTFKRNGVDGERVQIIGSLAERVAAKALGVEWTGWIDRFRQSDLHFNIEVRLIGDERYGLRVYPKDDDSRRVMGVVIPKGQEAGPYRIPGWINAIHGKKEHWLADPLGRGHPVYLVPQDRLHHLAKLKNLI